MTAKFETGRTYQTRSVVDSGFWTTINVISRTPKTIRVATQLGEKTLRVHFSPYFNAETVKPWGSYSMCPVITATDR